MNVLRNVREVFKALKRRGPSRIYCPRCGSPKIKPSSALDRWLTPEKYVCEGCGYVGPVVMELEEDSVREG